VQAGLANLPIIVTMLVATPLSEGLAKMASAGRLS